jgi:uncharacterized protein YjbI with pentapeptide repeats
MLILVKPRFYNENEQTIHDNTLENYRQLKIQIIDILKSIFPEPERQISYLDNSYFYTIRTLAVESNMNPNDLLINYYAILSEYSKNNIRVETLIYGVVLATLRFDTHEGNQHIDMTDNILLSGDYLGDIRRSGELLSWVVLEKVIFSTVVTPTDYSGTNFSGSTIKNSNFSNATLIGADFSETKLSGSNFLNADLRFTRFNQSQSADIDPAEAHTVKTIFKNAKLYHSTFAQANFSGADFSGADVCFSNLRGCKLQRADFRTSKLTDSNFMGAILNEAKFNNADLRNTNLENADLRDTNFNGADISGANLQNALMSETTDFRNCTMDNDTYFSDDVIGMFDENMFNADQYEDEDEDEDEDDEEYEEERLEEDKKKKKEEQLAESADTKRERAPKPKTLLLEPFVIDISQKINNSNITYDDLKRALMPIIVKKNKLRISKMKQSQWYSIASLGNTPSDVWENNNVEPKEGNIFKCLVVPPPTIGEAKVYESEQVCMQIHRYAGSLNIANLKKMFQEVLTRRFYDKELEKFYEQLISEQPGVRFNPSEEIAKAFYNLIMNLLSIHNADETKDGWTHVYDDMIARKRMVQHAVFNAKEGIMFHPAFQEDNLFLLKMFIESLPLQVQVAWAQNYILEFIEGYGQKIDTFNPTQRSEQGFIASCINGNLEKLLFAVRTAIVNFSPSHIEIETEEQKIETMINNAITGSMLLNYYSSLTGDEGPTLDGYKTYILENISEDLRPHYLSKLEDPDFEEDMLDAITELHGGKGKKKRNKKTTNKHKTNLKKKTLKRKSKCKWTNKKQKTIKRKKRTIKKRTIKKRTIKKKSIKKK